MLNITSKISWTIFRNQYLRDCNLTFWTLPVDIYSKFKYINRKCDDHILKKGLSGQIVNSECMFYNTSIYLFYSLFQIRAPALHKLSSINSVLSKKKWNLLQFRRFFSLNHKLVALWVIHLNLVYTFKFIFLNFYVLHR